MSELYTPQSNTTQGHQTQNLAQIQQGLLNGSPMTPQQSQQVNQDYAATNQLIAQKSTPNTRQGYIDSSLIPGMQSDYSALAKQLAEYDNAVLKPQFAGTNPGMPSDIPRGGDVTWGNISALTPESAKLSADKGLFNTNPAYAYAAQNSQTDALTTLLSGLNDAIGKELRSKKGEYASDLATYKDLLDPLTRILQMNTQLEMKRMEEAERAANRGDSQRDRDDAAFDRIVNQVRDEFQRGDYSLVNDQGAWGQAFDSIKSRFPNRTDDEINDALGGKATYDSKTGTWTGTNKASSDYLAALGIKSRKDKPLTLSENLALENTNSGIIAVNKVRGVATQGNLVAASNPLTRLWNTDAQTLYNMEQEFADVLTRIRTGAALNEQEIEEYGKKTPRLGDTSQTIKDKLDWMENFYSGLQMRINNRSPYSSILNKQSTEGGGRPPLSSFDK